MHSTTIAAFMTPSPHTIRCEQCVETARRLMQQYRVRHLPVMEGDAVVGVVSQRDVQPLGPPHGEEARRVRVAEVMTAAVAMVPPETPLAAAVRQMAVTKTGSMLVGTHGVLVGIFTTTDALRALGQLLEVQAPRVEQ
jgi:acetoin utilization protein AcuB